MTPASTPKGTTWGSGTCCWGLGKIIIRIIIQQSNREQREKSCSKGSRQLVCEMCFFGGGRSTLMAPPQPLQSLSPAPWRPFKLARCHQ